MNAADMKRILISMILFCIIMATSGCGEKQPTIDEGEYQTVRLLMTCNGMDITMDAKVCMKFAELVSEASNGNVKIDVFTQDLPAGGDMGRGVEMVADGAVDMGSYAANVLSLLDERLSIASVPWAFDNYRQVRHIIDTSGSAYYEKVLAVHGLTYLGSTHNGFRQLSNNKHPIQTPEELEGLKIRVPGGEFYFQFWRAFGVEPISVTNLSAVPSAIRDGEVDGQENGFNVTNSARLNEVQRYMTVWNYTYENYLFVANAEVFDSLEPRTQELIRSKMKEACEWGRDLVESNDENLRKQFIDGGMEITVLTPEQLKPFQEKIANVRKAMMEKYGAEACEAFRIH